MAYTIPAFDTLRYSSKLIDAGFSDAQAKAQTDALTEVIDSRLATKEDLKALELATKEDIKALEVSTKQDFKALEMATKQDIKALEVATKQDFKALEMATKRDIQSLEMEIKTLELNMKSLESRLLMKLGSMVAGSTTLLATMMMVLH